ncbi:hypothetical protein EZ428_12235 [Pedobacter frigiditerrae]|uniref:phospholipase D n=1 Tax=Pedobacter frigiditerrae TaxID=2530452 RepID=A0A4R0MSQ6_9SPHI|nr:phospholipase D-like domain-containing protein [Pedobacter frigiditerrae]TCC90051.1 hypothetical protein EZ428_12235 [Pedobacter frigiditerrae]
MRSKSQPTQGYTVYAVSGTNTVSFTIDFRDADTANLLGFAFERVNLSTGEKKVPKGYKVFGSVIPNPDKDTSVETFKHPIQSFVWDDFTCTAGESYKYAIYPMTGKPNALKKNDPITIQIETEPYYTTGEHDVFFNSGVASSQAYARKFNNLRPDKITDPILKAECKQWLSRELDDAILKFIGQAAKGDMLYACFYEFRYEPVVTAFKKAIDKGVKVKIIIDAKNNPKLNEENEMVSFPRDANLKMLQDIGIALDQNIILREANKGSIQHNKFIVFQKGGEAAPAQVWTGSTNISEGGFHGQTNVGHWIRNKETATAFKKYWTILSVDPGQLDNGDDAGDKAKMASLRLDIEKLYGNFEFRDWNDIQQGITCIFSPRSTEKVLKSYAAMFDSADVMACVTLAFGVNDVFKQALVDNLNTDQLSFMLLEKPDEPKKLKDGKKPKKPFVYINAKQNVYKAWGAYLNDPLYQWTREVSTRQLKLNTHVAYVHSKFMLIDPLGDDPVVITGSANFSGPSTTSNDENMVIIRGNRRVADIYYTEFNRINNHYYFRAVYNKVNKDDGAKRKSLFLAETAAEWLEDYKPGTLKYKKVVARSTMDV